MFLVELLVSMVVMVAAVATATGVIANGVRRDAAEHRQSIAAVRAAVIARTLERIEWPKASDDMTMSAAVAESWRRVGFESGVDWDQVRIETDTFETGGRRGIHVLISVSDQDAIARRHLWRFRDGGDS